MRRKWRSLATVGAAAVKGSTAANGFALGAFAGAIFGPVAGVLGSWIGYKSSLIRGYDCVAKRARKASKPFDIGNVTDQ